MEISKQTREATSALASGPLWSHWCAGSHVSSDTGAVDQDSSGSCRSLWLSPLSHFVLHQVSLHIPYKKTAFGISSLLPCRSLDTTQVIRLGDKCDTLSHLTSFFFLKMASCCVALSGQSFPYRPGWPQAFSNPPAPVS